MRVAMRCCTPASLAPMKHSCSAPGTGAGLPYTPGQVAGAGAATGLVGRRGGFLRVCFPECGLASRVARSCAAHVCFALVRGMLALAGLGGCVLIGQSGRGAWGCAAVRPGAHCGVLCVAFIRDTHAACGGRSERASTAGYLRPGSSCVVMCGGTSLTPSGLAPLACVAVATTAAVWVSTV